MVVVLDDVTLAPLATGSVRSIATQLMEKAGPGDDVSVVRFSNRADEPYGDLKVALMRISEYQAGQAGVAPFDIVHSTEELLQLVARVSRRLEINGRRRKAIVCIGSQAVCNVVQPVRTARGSIWKDWVNAVDAAARANVSIYALMASRGWLPGLGLAYATGGEVFAGASDLRPSIDRIWRDMSYHYLVGYWPTGSSKEVHSINVKVRRAGARVLTRRWRGR